MTDKQIIEPCMGCSALECWGVVDCDVAQRVLALHKTLTEIKEIVEHFYKTGFLRTDDNCILINNNTCVETLDKILQKISECEVE